MITQILLYASGIIVPISGLLAWSYRRMGKAILVNNEETKNINYTNT